MNVSGNNIGGEGLSFWIMKASPVSIKKFLQIKIYYSSIISIACGVIGIIILYITLRPGPLYLVSGFFLLVLFSWGESIIGTSIGSFFPEFKPVQTSKSNITFTGGLLTFISFAVYLLVFGGIAIGVLFAGSFFSWPELVSFPVIVAIEFI